MAAPHLLHQRRDQLTSDRNLSGLLVDDLREPVPFVTLGLRQREAGGAGPAVASCLIPGVGQLMNDQPVKGVVFILLNISLGIGYYSARTDGAAMEAAT